jgi:hypothetical protein
MSVQQAQASAMPIQPKIKVKVKAKAKAKAEAASEPSEPAEPIFSCSVCLETFNGNSLIRDGTCSGAICKTCYLQLEPKDKCPTCRTDYPWRSAAVGRSEEDYNAILLAGMQISRNVIARLTREVEELQHTLLEACKVISGELSIDMTLKLKSASHPARPWQRLVYRS